MFSSPFVLDGVKADFNPRSAMKSGLSLDISSGGFPANPLINIAARPFVSWESESAM